MTIKSTVSICRCWNSHAGNKLYALHTPYKQHRLYSSHTQHTPHTPHTTTEDFSSWRSPFLLVMLFGTAYYADQVYAESHNGTSFISSCLSSSIDKSNTNLVESYRVQMARAIARERILLQQARLPSSYDLSNVHNVLTSGSPFNVPVGGTGDFSTFEQRENSKVANRRYRDSIRHEIDAEILRWLGIEDKATDILQNM
ncbi:hypothetical protein NEOLI_002330 [Neolecta irregularis DAH-3]|uniref:Uncharacterized protein n=1 Tax=Neolecta irregularis (strain DAH-3) TaxID=1198029 RepID=A0A1U7LV94_NEOID|nr:hypothetical protein NEOLI_002330 [Neolecta irregularis DAH-3]|eukprot:OLL26493.1 hypothetical protein NEOLI_002330 [Neolecta irregularis DAH-3]